VIAAGDIFVSQTVCLETAWVLSSGYGFTADQVASGLSGFAGLPGITIEDPVRLAMAIDWMRGGMDFADALHLGVQPF